jgi:hypothetical protein
MAGLKIMTYTDMIPIPIPEFCILVTLADLTMTIENIINYDNILKELFTSKDERLNDPIANLEQLEELFGKLNIHYFNAPEEEMRTYINYKYVPCLELGNPEFGTLSHTIRKSGLYKNGSNIIEIPQSSRNYSNPIEYNEYIRYIYNLSLWPMCEHIVYATRTNIPAKLDTYIQFHYTIDQSRLFKLHPGIHYNFSYMV